VKTKQPGKHAARDLYASDWFKKARAYAERNGDAWFILSAEHGLLSPSEPIEPYEKTLKNMNKKEQMEWGARVLAKLRGILAPSDRVILLAGKAYVEPLIEGLRTVGVDVETPLRGMRSGEQKQWLKHNG
jgi:hypothetical protein